MLHNPKRIGFTLLELIVVIIIVGVLASVAIPRMFRMIEISYATEALHTLGTIKRAYGRCHMAAAVTYGEMNTDGECGMFGQLDMGDPSFLPGSNFVYALNAGPGTVTLMATRNGNNGGDNGLSRIEIVYDLINEQVTSRTGFGVFSSVK
jgi:prepilin-type N-terminal cleavage/methylation domain-containing protein